MKYYFFLIVTFVSALSADAYFKQPAINIDTAQKIVNEVLLEAKKRKLQLAVAIMDPGGHLVTFSRIDGTKPGVLQIAQNKAKSSAIFRTSTRHLQGISQPGSVAYGLHSFPNVMTIPGGVDITHNGLFLGGLGVSGTKADEDEEIAKLALKRVLHKSE